MYTANTMAAAIEALGMSLPYSSSNPALSEEKKKECLAAGAAIRLLLEKDIRPRDIMTREVFVQRPASGIFPGLRSAEHGHDR